MISYCKTHCPWGAGDQCCADCLNYDVCEEACRDNPKVCRYKEKDDVEKTDK